jgi:pSer/pThr/pTyr-binding forkhead associated (FHA) protein
MSKNQRFELPAGETNFGRESACGLVLPNVSVSRQHGRFLVGSQGVNVEDLESKSGILVNGERIEQHNLRSGDEVQVGKFSMVFLGDGRQDRFYKGRFVEYLAEYAAGTVMLDDGAATFALTPEALKRLQQDSHLVETARFRLESDSRRFWYPEDRPLTFGGKGMVQVDGWFTWGTPAEANWDGRKHIIKRNSWWTSIKVNGESLENRRPLRNGDRIQIGKTAFIYDVE